jgi:DNA-binding beta-propeller fold protein YncE
MNTRISEDLIGMLVQTMKRAGMALALALFCLSGAGPAWLKAGSAAAMSGPMRAADTPLGLMVGDFVGGSVVFLNPNTLAVKDTLLLPTEAQDPGPVLRTKPTGVAYLNGRFYVGDERSGSILVYERPGLFKKNGDVEDNPRKLGEWTQVSQFAIGAPSDIVADESEGLLFVASRADQTVYVLDEAGVVVRTIGGSTIALPQGLALDRNTRRVYVSDEGGRNCGSFGSCYGVVRVYDYEGTPLGSISGRSGALKFARNQGVTVDSWGDVYLVDSYRSQVLVFREVGVNSWEGIGTFGLRGGGLKQLLLPMDAVVTGKPSTVYVTDSMRRRIEVFSIEDMEAVQ